MSMSVALPSWELLHSVSVSGPGAHVSESAAALNCRGRELYLVTRDSPGQGNSERVNWVHYRHLLRVERGPFEGEDAS